MEKYAVSNLIGEGSFGKVYKAVDKTTKVTVALKIINKRGRSGRELKGLRGECEIQRNIQHPNIIRMLDSHETPNEIIVVTEYAKMDLHKLLRDGSLSETKTQKITFDLVSALYYLHSHRILHRDLKPQNILLDRNMCAKLCDFGFARNMTMGTHVLTSIKGTPLYMAPELLEAKPYDHHADLWSLGCIIYEMLAGEPPFSSTSMIHLVRLIRNQYIKWPSYLTSNCISFVQGLLERDPSQRMSWTNILSHSFVQGNIIIIDENYPQSPFTSTLMISQSRAKVNQSQHLLHPSGRPKEVDKPNNEELTTSKDSINVILQSDVEYQETDNDDCAGDGLAESGPRNVREQIFSEGCEQQLFPNVRSYDLSTHLTNNTNLCVNYFNDNFPLIPLHHANDSQRNIFSLVQPGFRENVFPNEYQSQELERCKLSQSIDNFSIRIGSEKQLGQLQPSTSQQLLPSTIGHVFPQKNNEKITPTLFPGWDACDESQNPPIENEEWLVFLQRSMQDILDGELDSLKQRNFVCIIVAPLRNCRTNSKVIENVAHLLSLPLAIDIPPTIKRDIINVYGELKLVPNLVYASKLLCNKPSSTELTDYNESETPMSTSPIRQLAALDNDEVKTLTALYDLICYLIHTGDVFMNQFCDAIEILGAKKLFVSFFSIVHKNSSYVRLVCSLLALLNCAMRELPENAEIIEQIIFDENIDLPALLKHEDPILRLRSCMLLRILARFSCLAFQKRWSNELKECLESLCSDENLDVQREAKFGIKELKYLSFVAAELR
ncbi:serine/threonine-protein kinase fused [Anopheles bellator]|uniref:serine/threonine-protein kinase fused n=1 Tax=Anopheles bellator TaxID=139047 RepID=UPI00264721DD|nr:serine/threonine-protein kinase fused [Anopheles bellator]